MFVCAFVALSTARAVAEPNLDWLIGRWSGSIAGQGQILTTEVALHAFREGRLVVLDLDRKNPFGSLRERIVFRPGAGFAVSDAPYVPAARRDTVTFGGGGIVFDSDPWEIGAEEKLRLHWSLLPGRYVPAGPPRSRLFVDLPSVIPDPDALVMTWTGRLGETALGVEVGTLTRQR